MSEVDKIVVKIGADTFELQKGVKDANAQLGSLGKAANGVDAALAGITAALAGVAAGMIVSGKESIDYADNLNKLSQKIGVATEDLSKLAYAAKLSDVDVGALQQSFVILSRGLSEASQGSGNALSAFNALGIKFKEANGTLVTSDEMLMRVADRFKAIEDGAGKTALAVAIFGRAGASMIPMLNSGRDGIKEMGDELVRFGGVITTKYARDAEIFNDNLTRLQTILSGFTINTFAPLVAGINAAVEGFAKLNPQIQGFMSAWGALTAGLTQNKDLTGAFAEVQSNIVSVKKNIEGLSQNPMSKVFNADDIALFTAQLKFLEGQAATLQAQINAARGAPTATTGGEKPPQMEDTSTAQKELDKLNQLKAVLAEKYTVIRQSFLDEVELENQKYAMDQQILLDAYNTKFISEQQYKTDLENLELEHQNKMSQIVNQGNMTRNKWDAMSGADRVKTVAGFLQQMTAATANSSKEMFEINKAASLAQGLVTAYKTVMDAYKFGNEIGGPYVGAAMAAVAGAAQFATLSSIASSQYQGGSTAAPSGIGQTAAGVTPVQQVNSAGQSGGGNSGQVVNISLQGNSFNRDQVRNLLTQINDVISEGSVLRIN